MFYVDFYRLCIHPGRLIDLLMLFDRMCFFFGFVQVLIRLFGNRITIDFPGNNPGSMIIISCPEQDRPRLRFIH